MPGTRSVVMLNAVNAKKKGVGKVMPCRPVPSYDRTSGFAVCGRVERG